MDKAFCHYEVAAMCGHVFARNNLGVIEGKAKNYDLALQHMVISAKLGHEKSLNMVKRLFMDGLATKSDYASALRGYQNAIEEMSSSDRDEVKAFLDFTCHVFPCHINPAPTTLSDQVEFWSLGMDFSRSLVEPSVKSVDEGSIHVAGRRQEPPRLAADNPSDTLSKRFGRGTIRRGLAPPADLARARSGERVARGWHCFSADPERGCGFSTGQERAPVPFHSPSPPASRFARTQTLLVIRSSGRLRSTSPCIELWAGRATAPRSPSCHHQRHPFGPSVSPRPPQRRGAVPLAAPPRRVPIPLRGSPPAAVTGDSSEGQPRPTAAVICRSSRFAARTRQCRLLVAPEAEVDTCPVEGRKGPVLRSHLVPHPPGSAPAADSVTPPAPHDELVQYNADLLEPPKIPKSLRLEGQHLPGLSPPKAQGLLPPQAVSAARLVSAKSKQSPGAASCDRARGCLAPSGALVASTSATAPPPTPS
ncbi:hypothetical protein THAOC_21999 [Thalassiosira oceanica]|uniref:Uncharacterized protein n=1 Tax=Thalassiosira oceanica TaxID=159749 RepID=K0RVR9_THAOC|nr:hypothetical protein THAOC_21999 [Thalassiosira oceanica]|eukprot:EJK57918.1 hypothetical protein THAOC_21999 [Thalassiosira oceanica]